jgi:hypothetical protein
MTNQNDVLSSVIAASAFASGSLEISYTTGSLPIDLNLENSGLGDAASSNGVGPGNSDVIFEINGQWMDENSNDGGVGFSMNAGQSLTIPFWIYDIDVLSNAQPTLNQAELNQMTASFVPTVSQLYNQATVSVSGSHTASCSGSGGSFYVLLPFAQLPFSQSSDGAGDTISCSASSGGQIQ